VFSEQPDGTYKLGTEHTVNSNAKSAERVCLVFLISIVSSKISKITERQEAKKSCQMNEVFFLI
jgi:hypothetical protein